MFQILLIVFLYTKLHEACLFDIINIWDSALGLLVLYHKVIGFASLKAVKKIIWNVDIIYYAVPMNT